MANFFVYDNATGEIVRTGSAPDGMESIQAFAVNEIALAGTADEETQYFDLITETVEDKAASTVTIDDAVTTVVTQDDHDNDIWLQFPVGTVLAIADSLYNMAFDNIPNPSQLYLNGELLTEITDGELELALDLPSAPATIERFKQQIEQNPSFHNLEIKSVAYLPFQVNVYAI